MLQFLGGAFIVGIHKKSSGSAVFLFPLPHCSPDETRWIQNFGLKTIVRLDLKRIALLRSYAPVEVSETGMNLWFLALK